MKWNETVKANCSRASSGGIEGFEHGDHLAPNISTLAEGVEHLGNGVAAKTCPQAGFQQHTRFQRIAVGRPRSGLPCARRFPSSPTISMPQHRAAAGPRRNDRGHRRGKTSHEIGQALGNMAAAIAPNTTPR